MITTRTLLKQDRLDHAPLARQVLRKITG